MEETNDKTVSENNINQTQTSLIGVLNEKATKKLSKKKKEQYGVILNYMADKGWHKTSEIADILELKTTRTKELLKELVALDILEDNGKTKGKLYRLK